MRETVFLQRKIMLICWEMTSFSDIHGLLDLLEYHRWANEKVLQTVSVLSAEKYTKDLRSSFPSIRDTLIHIYGADRVWLGRIQQGQTPEWPKPQDYSTVASLREMWLEILSTFPSVVQSLNPEQLISYKAFDGTLYSNKLGDIIRHIVNHGTYHRGQITVMLRQLGEKAVTTDMIAYYRLKG
jgi:uncharacterized damage-inducible protein DinB